jgi:hypothetical protein
VGYGLNEIGDFLKRNLDFLGLVEKLKYLKFSTQDIFNFIKNNYSIGVEERWKLKSLLGL